MSELKVDSVQPETHAGGANQEATQESAAPVSDESSHRDSVKYETYQRTLSEAKKAKARLAELEAKTSLLEQEKLEGEGKKDELIAKLKERVSDVEKKYKEGVGNFAYQSLQSQIQSEATKLGCVDVDALTRLVDLDVLDVDESTFRADSEQVRDLVESAKRDRPYLFSKKGPAIGPHIPNTTHAPSPENDLKKLSTEELKAKIKEIDAKLKR